MVIYIQFLREHKQKGVATMKVTELMEMLKNMDGDAEVRFEDTYWQNEGYGKNAENPEYLTRLVRVVRVEDMNGKNAVVLRSHVSLAEG